MACLWCAKILCQLVLTKIPFLVSASLPCCFPYCHTEITAFGVGILIVFIKASQCRRSTESEFLWNVETFEASMQPKKMRISKENCCWTFIKFLNVVIKQFWDCTLCKLTQHIFKYECTGKMWKIEVLSIFAQWYGIKKWY